MFIIKKVYMFIYKLEVIIFLFIIKNFYLPLQSILQTYYLKHIK